MTERDGPLGDIAQWWQIAQVAGSGMAIVLVPVAWLLWKRNEADAEYIRQSEKNTLVVLGDIVKVVESGDKEGVRGVADLMKAVQIATDSIKAHIDARFK